MGKNRFRVAWSPDDGEYVGLCAEFPSLSWLAHTPEAALEGIRRLVGEVVSDMEKATDIPTSGFEDYITNLAREHGVRYEQTPDDALAEVITRLSDDDVQMDRVELLLLALERAGVIASESVVPLHIYYLREKLSMRKKLDDMLAGMTPENRHAEVDFGEAVGREKNIADYLPRRLDEIVTRNRDQVEIRLATDTEVAALGEFLGSPEGSDGEVKDTLTGWYPVFLRVKENHVIRLLGQREKSGDITLVSHVRMLDQAAGLAITSRSIYRLEKRGEGEPPRPYVIHLCAILNEMGLGERLGLPEVFFSPVSIEDMNKAIAREGAKAGCEDFDDLQKGEK